MKRLAIVLSSALLLALMATPALAMAPDTPPVPARGANALSHPKTQPLKASAACQLG